MKQYNFFGSLDTSRTASIINFLLECKRDNEDAIMLIESSGGDAYGLNAIYETLKDTKVKLTTIGIGFVASAATAIFAMGDERILLPDTEYLVHYVRHSCSGKLQEHDHEQYLEISRRLNEKMRAMYGKTGLTPEIIHEHCSGGRDWYMTPEEIKKYGITTRSHEDWSRIIIDAMKSNKDTEKDEE